MDQLRYTPDNISSLGEDEIFVFGSNLAGNHAGGAARVALERFGAVMGQGVGIQGRSYAIPTMQGSLESIKPYVDDFFELAEEWDQTTFLVTRIGCALDMYNVVLPESFVRILQARRSKG